MLALIYWTTFTARDSATRAAEIMPENVEALVASSNEHYQAQRYGEALAAIEALVARYPTQHVCLQRPAMIRSNVFWLACTLDATGPGTRRSLTPRCGARVRRR